MAAQKEPTISYSDIYYRPVDTKVAPKGWYVDKYITLRINAVTVEQKTVIMPFANKGAALAFVRAHGGCRGPIE